MDIEGEHQNPDQRMEPGTVVQRVAAMTDQSLSCERAIEERYRLSVEIPRTWEERSENHCLEYPEYRSLCDRLIQIVHDTISGLLGLLIGCALPFSIFGIPIIMRLCQKSPSLTLEDVNIHNMVVYQNTTDTQYQVRSEFSVIITAYNRNEVTKCFVKYRRMRVSVEFEGQQILHQEVPLVFKLKPKESRTLMLDLSSGDGYYPVRKQSAWNLDFQVRNSSTVELAFSFDSRVMRKARKASWIRKRCDTITGTPANGNFSTIANSGNSTGGGLLWSLCEMNVIH